VGAGRQFLLILGGWKNTLSGLEMVNDQRVAANPTRKSFGLQNGRRYEALVQVRTNGVHAYVDGALLTELKTDFANVGPTHGWELKHGATLGLGSFRSPTVFHHAEVVEVSGPGQFLRPGDPAAQRAMQQALEQRRAAN
jgi:hypothetical protein